MPLTRTQTVLVAPSHEPDRKYRAVIHDLRRDGIVLDLSSAPVEFPAGTPLTVWFWDHHAVYRFDTVVLQPKMRISALFTVQRPSALRRTIKRRYRRIRLGVEAVLKDSDGTSTLRASLLDLGAGGARILGPPGFAKGDTFRLSFTLPDGQAFDDIDCQILRSKPAEAGRAEYGVSFRDLSGIRQAKLEESIAKAIINGEAEVLP